MGRSEDPPLSIIPVWAPPPVVSQDEVITRRRDFAKISQGAVLEIALDDATRRPRIFDRALFFSVFQIPPQGALANQRIACHIFFSLSGHTLSATPRGLWSYGAQDDPRLRRRCFRLSPRRRRSLPAYGALHQRGWRVERRPLPHNVRPHSRSRRRRRAAAPRPPKPSLHLSLLLHLSVLLDGVVPAEDVEPAKLLHGGVALRLLWREIGELEQLLDAGRLLGGVEGRGGGGGRGCTRKRTRKRTVWPQGEG